VGSILGLSSAKRIVPFGLVITIE